MEKGSKLYFTIGEVAEALQLPESTIRFWENEFDVIKPQRNKKGNRLFTRQDLENLKIINYMVKVKGYTLSGAKVKLKEERENYQRKMAVEAVLMDMRAELEALRAMME